MMRNFALILLIHVLFGLCAHAQTPLRMAVAGLTHGHVDWVFNGMAKDDVEVVGIYETNAELVDRYAKRYSLDRSLFYSDLGQMLAQVKPEAVAAFGAISEHVGVVRACAPLGVHVMVEKPLATTVADAEEIEALATAHGIHVLTNFETSWYASNEQAKALLDEGQLGEIRKVLVNDGHEGPKEIGVSPEFLEILTDPEKNGAGALVDFGCYGANLMTWLMQGERPLSVTAVVQRNKPHIYREVDDEATLILQYPRAQCVIQGSWNWPFSRKDMELYGTQGYAIAPDAGTLRQRVRGGQEEERRLAPRVAPFDNPFSVLAAVVRGRLVLDEFDQYGLRVNVVAVEILDAAMRSAATGETVWLTR